MKKIIGKYNTANIMAEEKNIDAGVITQISKVCDLDFMSDTDIVVMPDCHVGKGCTIGTTIDITNCKKIIPNLVGVDIGCSVSALPMYFFWNNNLKDFDKIVKDNIPTGFNIRNKENTSIEEISVLEGLFNSLETLKMEFSEEMISRAIFSIGTLGGGNHFIEVDEMKTVGFLLTVHTGSRNFGHTIASYYQNKAIEYCKNMNIDKDLCYLEGEDLKNYLHDMRIAQDYAKLNSMYILAKIYSARGNIDINKSLAFTKNNLIRSTHNYIDFSDDKIILRKGAISAKKNEPVIIPLNMKDGIILGKGLGKKDWNCSAPHGAGRLYSRSQAKKKIKMEDFIDSMDGIFTTCVSLNTLDEAPMAYKDHKEIIDSINENTIKILAIAKPIYSFKDNSQKRW